MRSACETTPQLLAYLRGSELLQGVLPCGVDEMLSGIESVWLRLEGKRLHVELHRAPHARAVVVFQPGVGSYARFYCALGARLARAGYHLLAIDRPGHGYSEGETGDCTVEEALDVTQCVADYARATFGLPVILAGSSLGGLLTGFAVFRGIPADLAIAHNFVIPGRLLSFRIRGRLLERKPHGSMRTARLAHQFKNMTRDPVLQRYVQEEADPRVAWQLSNRAVASLFRHNPRLDGRQICPLVVLHGAADALVPTWAVRWFMRWSRLPDRELVPVPGAGHMLYHEDLNAAMPLLERLMEPMVATAGRQGAP